MFVQLGYLAGETSSDTSDKESFASNIAGQISNVLDVRCNFIIPDSTVVAAHIADVPPPPEYQYIAFVNTGDGPLPDVSASTSEAGSVLRYPVICKASPYDSLGQGGATRDAAAEIRQLCLIKRRADMTSAEFMEYYESNHAPLAEKHLSSIASYARYFVQDAAAAEFDVITEICFANADDHARFMTDLANPAIGEMFARDEEKLFDRKSICLFLVQQVIVAQP